MLSAIKLFLFYQKGEKTINLIISGIKKILIS